MRRVELAQEKHLLQFSIIRNLITESNYFKMFKVQNINIFKNKTKNIIIV